MLVHTAPIFKVIAIFSKNTIVLISGTIRMAQHPAPFPGSPVAGWLVLKVGFGLLRREACTPVSEPKSTLKHICPTSHLSSSTSHVLRINNVKGKRAADVYKHEAEIFHLGKGCFRQPYKQLIGASNRAE